MGKDYFGRDGIGATGLSENAKRGENVTKVGKLPSS